MAHGRLGIPMIFARIPAFLLCTVNVTSELGAGSCTSRIFSGWTNGSWGGLY